MSDSSKTMAFEAARDQIAAVLRRNDLNEEQRYAARRALEEIAIGMAGLPVSAVETDALKGTLNDLSSLKQHATAWQRFPCPGTHDGQHDFNLRNSDGCACCGMSEAVLKHGSAVETPVPTSKQSDAQCCKAFDTWFREHWGEPEMSTTLRLTLEAFEAGWCARQSPETYVCDTCKQTIRVRVTHSHYGPTCLACTADKPSTEDERAAAAIAYGPMFDRLEKERETKK